MINIYSLEKDNVPFYIGKTKNKINNRLGKHKSIYGNDIIISLIDEVEDNEWKFWECFWIEQFKAWGFELTNQNNGGGGPLFHSAETRLKMSLNSKGFKHTESAKIAIRDKALGRIKSDEWKRKIGLGNKGNHKKLGVKISQESKDKIRDKLLGRKITWKNGRKPGYKMSQETKDKIQLARIQNKINKQNEN